MIVSAVIECKWCGYKTTIPTKKTTRSFNIAFNKLKRVHDWDCETQGKVREKVDKAKKSASDAIEKIMAKT